MIRLTPSLLRAPLIAALVLFSSQGAFAAPSGQLVTSIEPKHCGDGGSGYCIMISLDSSPTHPKGEVVWVPYWNSKDQIPDAYQKLLRFWDASIQREKEVRLDRQKFNDLVRFYVSRRIHSRSVIYEKGESEEFDRRIAETFASQDAPHSLRAQLKTMNEILEKANARIVVLEEKAVQDRVKIKKLETRIEALEKKPEPSPTSDKGE